MAQTKVRHIVSSSGNVTFREYDADADPNHTMYDILEEGDTIVERHTDNFNLSLNLYNKHSTQFFIDSGVCFDFANSPSDESVEYRNRRADHARKELFDNYGAENS